VQTLTHRGLAADAAIHKLAGRQRGVVSRRQLIEAAVSGDTVDRRVRAGLLRLVHPGVYRVGYVVAAGWREMAAALSCGARAAVSHRSAAGVWQVAWLLVASDPVEVIAPEGNRSRRHDVRVRRLRTLRPDEVTTLDGIPVTTPARTLVDLAAVAGVRDLERAFGEAVARRLTTGAAVLDVLSRHPRQPGSRALRSVLGSDQLALTRSEAEERLLRLIRRSGLPEPGTNVRICGYEVDFLWRSQRVVVEVDGHAFHSTPERFESDRLRDGVLAAAGLRVMRVTWRQMTHEPEAILVRLAAALAVVDI
jgi:very-short-patch-repair endonuclease